MSRPTGFRASSDTRPRLGESVEGVRESAETDTRLLGQTPIAEGNAREMRTNEIQQQVGRGEYRVDTQAVADAILRRLLGSDHLRGAAPRSGDRGE